MTFKILHIYILLFSTNFSIDFHQLTVKIISEVSRLEGDVKAICVPGQFVNLKLDGFYLRRPISVCDYDENSVTIIYKVVGEGTEKMRTMKAGEVIDTLTGLGNGYDTSVSGDRPMLIGGGVGIPPMYGLGKRLIAQGKKVKVILGFNKESEIFCKEDFEAIGAETYVTTVDGSVGIKGFVTDAKLKEWGMWDIGHKHARDACRHCVYYLVSLRK